MNDVLWFFGVVENDLVVFNLWCWIFIVEIMYEINGCLFVVDEDEFDEFVGEFGIFIEFEFILSFVFGFGCFVIGLLKCLGVWVYDMGGWILFWYYV